MLKEDPSTPNQSQKSKTNATGSFNKTASSTLKGLDRIFHKSLLATKDD